MTPLTPTPLLHSLLPSLQQALRTAAAHWAALRRRLRDRQALAEMSPRELRDLGLGRDEIDYLTAPSSPARWAE